MQFPQRPMPWRTHGQHGAGIDLVDAHHPQTMLAYGMNGKDLPVAHGAPPAGGV